MAKCADAELRVKLFAEGWTYSLPDDLFYRPLNDGSFREEYGHIADGEFVIDGPPEAKEAPTIMSADCETFDETLWPNYGLRDMFAMHFLSGLVAKHGSFSLDAPNAAIKSYEFADAMMIAREMKRER